MAHDGNNNNDNIDDFAVLSSSQMMYEPTHWRVAIVYRSQPCTLRYSRTTDRVSITRVTRRGREVVLLHLPTAVVLNVETDDECAARQRARGVGDAVVRDGFRSSGMASASSLPCFWPSAATAAGDAAYDRSTKYAHSRTTSVDVAADAHDADDDAGASSHATAVTVAVANASALPSRDCHYHLHYVRARRNEVPTLHTVSYAVAAATWPEGAAQLRTLHAALLRRVYAGGVSRLHVFVSPTSGKGDGVHVYASKVYPLVHFARHAVRTFVTTRAHECEDYVASLRHRLDARDVVVAVGGDGMVHEAVNGLHRRKLALLQRWRVSQQHAVPSTAETAAGGSCNSHSSDESSEAKVAHDAANATTADTHDRTTAAPPSSSSSSSTMPPLLLLSPPTSFLHTPLLHNNNTQQPSAAHARRRVDGGADDVHAADAATAQMLRSWDALLPRVATVPAGSACGLAKSMDVLSLTTAALALVHLHTCHMDLLRLRFRGNDELLAHHRQHLGGTAALQRAQKAFALYRSRYAAELRARRAVDGQHTQQQQQQQQRQQQQQQQQRATTTTPPSPPSPYLADGTPVFTDVVTHHVGAPELRERVAFMSLSFGVANDIDHGSEGLRWMGNARFTVYGGYLLLRGIRTYTAVLRYLPWESSATGLRVEKLTRRDKMPHASQLPQCTMREHCPHCEQHAQSVTCLAASSSLLQLHEQQQHDTHVSRPSTATADDSDEGNNNNNNKQRQKSVTRRGEGNEAASHHKRVAPHADNGDGDDDDRVARADGAPLIELTSPAQTATATATTAAATAAATCTCSDAQLLGEDEVDFDDDTLPWVTLRGEFYNLLFCNLRDVAQDMIMAPMSHLSDGAIDVVFSRHDDEVGAGGGRREFLQFFTSLKSGAHVHYNFTNYVKARAAEVKMDRGIAMADGEMMPLAAVRVSKLRNGVQLVRSE